MFPTKNKLNNREENTVKLNGEQKIENREGYTFRIIRIKDSTLAPKNIQVKNY